MSWLNIYSLLKKIQCNTYNWIGRTHGSTYGIMFRHNLGLVLCFLLCSACAIELTAQEHLSQEYKTTEMATHSQLPVADVRTIIEDSEGYMWYATKNGGLCRDNGYTIDVFRSDRYHPDLIGNSNVLTCIAEDKNGNIVFGTLDGLYLLDKRDYSVHLVNAELKGKTVEPLIVASDSTIWTSAGHTIYHFGKDYELRATFPCIWRGEERYACRMGEVKGRVWVSLWDGGLVQYDPTADELKELYWEEGLQPMNCVESKGEKDKWFWVATWGKGIVKYWPEEKRIERQEVTTEGSALGGEVIHMVGDGQRLYASTMDGLRVYNIEREVDNGVTVEVLSPTDLNGAATEKRGITNDLTLDHDQNLWVAGGSPHTFIISKNTTGVSRQSYDGKPTVWSSVSEEQDNTEWIWLGLEREMLTVVNNKTGQTLWAKGAGIGNFEHMNIACLVKRSEGKGIWAFEGKNIWHIWREGREIRAARECEASGNVTSLMDDGEGHLYIGHENGVDCFDSHTRTRTILPIKGLRVTDMAKSADGSLYFCCDNHCFCVLSPNQTQAESVRVLSEVGDFTSVCIDHKGTVWASTRQGHLVHYDPTTAEATLDKEGSNQRGDYIKHIGVDTLGHIWLLTDQEITEYSPKTGASRRLKTSDEEVRMDYFLGLRCQGDKVRIDGAGAWLSIKPLADLDKTRSEAHPRLTAIGIGGQTHIMGMGETSIDIEPNAMNIELQFSTLNHLNACKVAYAYRIKEIADEWQHLSPGTNKALFVKLPKGEYEVELMATDENGCWGEPVSVVTLNRKPSWWETGWAYALYALAIVALGVLLNQYDVMRRKEKKLQELVKQLQLPKAEPTDSPQTEPKEQNTDNGKAGGEKEEVIEKEREKEREKEKEKATAEDTGRMEAAGLNVSDQEFLREAMAVVQKNVTNEDYSIEQLASDMLMSRSTLYRRIKTTAGQKPNEFIRTIRLKHAAELVLQDKYSHAEIATMCGFSSTSYFYRCFKKQYGVQPGSYKEGKEEV